MKNCPFCNSPAHITSRPRGYRVECTKRFQTCPMNMRTSHHPTEKGAIIAWDTRYEGNSIDLSVCTYNDGKFDVMIKDDEGHDVVLSGEQNFNDEVIEWLLEIAPACVFTRYFREK